MITRSKSKTTNNNILLNPKSVNQTILSNLPSDMSNSSVSESNSTEDNSTSSNAAILNRIELLEQSVSMLTSQRNKLYTDYSRIQRKLIALQNYNVTIDRSLTALEMELSVSWPNMAGEKILKS